VLIFPLDLQDVEEVGGRRLDLDQVFIGAWYGVWKRGDFQIVNLLGWKSAGLF